MKETVLGQKEIKSARPYRGLKKLIKERIRWLKEPMRRWHIFGGVFEQLARHTTDDINMVEVFLIKL